MDASQGNVNVALWTGVLAGPIAFASALEAKFALLQYICRNHAIWILWLITILALLVTGFGAWCSWSGRAEARPYTRFMSTGGLIINTVFALAIIAMAIPDLFLRPCD